MAKTLSLGTLFKGEIDSTFRTTIEELRRMLSTLNGAIGNTSEVAKKQKAAMSSMENDLTQYGSSLGKATVESKKFQDALANGAEILNSKTGTAFKNFEAKLYRTEKAIQSQALSMESAGKHGGKWAEGVNRLSMMLQEHEGKLKYTRTGIERVVEKQKVLSDSTNKVTSDISEYAAAQGRAVNQSAKFRQALADGAQLYGKQGTSLQLLEANLYRTERAIQAHAVGMTNAGKDGETWAAGVNRLNMMQDELQNRVKYTRKGIVELTEAQQALLNQGPKVETVMSRFASTLKTMAFFGLASTAIYGTIRAMRDGVINVMEFDQSLKNLQAITSATDSEIKVMEKTIKSLAANTKYSAKEVADGLTIIGQAGFSASESIDTMKATVLLATGTLSTMKDTTDLLTTTIRAFELKATDSGRVADIMATAVNKSKLDVEKLRVAFSYLAPTAAEAGLSLEESAASTMLLADSGLRASTIGTALRQVIARLISPTKSLSEKFQSMGADMSKLDPATNSLKNILIELARVAPTAADAFELFGLRGAPAAIVLTRAVRDGSKAYDEYYKKVFEVGSAQEMADIQMQGLANKAKNLMNVIQLLTISIGEGGLGSTLGALIDALRVTFGLILKVTDSIGGGLVIAATSAAAAGWLLAKAFVALNLGGFISAISMVVRHLLGMGVVIEGLTARMGGFLFTILNFMKANPVVAIAAAVGGLLYWIKTQRELNAELGASIIELSKTRDGLQDYSTRLATLNPNTQEYSATLKRLANDYKELRPYIDTVSGKWIDQKGGLEALDKYMQDKHQEIIEKEIELIGNLATAYSRSNSSLMKWVFNLKEPEKQMKLLETAILAIVPDLKKLGIEFDSTAEEVEAAFQKMYPGINTQNVPVANVLSVLNDLRNKELADKEKAAEETAKIATGERKAVVSVYSAMYEDLEGMARKNAEEELHKLDDKVKKLDKSLAEGMISQKAYQAELLDEEVKTMEKIAEIRWQGVGLSEDVNNEVLNGVIRLIQSTRAQYFNDTAIENEKYKKKLDSAKSNNKETQRITDEHNLNLGNKEKAYVESINALISLAYEKRKFITQEGMTKILEETQKGVVQIAQAQSTGYDVSLDFETGQPAGITPPKRALPVTDKDILANQSDIVAKFAARMEKVVEKSSQYIKNLWGTLSEEGKGTFEDVVRKLDTEFEKINVMTKTPTQKLQLMREAYAKAMVEFANLQREQGDSQTKVQKGIAKTAETMRSIDMSHMSNKVEKERESFEQDVEKMQTSATKLKELIEEAITTGKSIPETTVGGLRISYDATGKDPVTMEKDKAAFIKAIDEELLAYRQRRWQDFLNKKGEIEAKENRKSLDSKESMLDLEIEAMNRAANDESNLMEKAHLKFWKEYLQIQKWALKVAEEQSKQGADASIDIEAGVNQQIKDSWDKLQEDLVKAKEKSSNKMYKAAEKKLSAENKALDAQYQIQRLEAQRNASTTEQLIQIDIEYYNKKYEKALEYYENLKMQTDMSNKDQATKLAEAANSAEQAFQKKYAAEKSYFEKTTKYEEQKWRSGEKTSEQYFAYLKEARKLDVIDEEEYIDKTIALNGTLWEQLQRGWQKAKREAKSFGEVVMSLAKEFPDKFASGMSSAIMSMIDGTKTAKEAMTDFFKSMISWILEAIIKQQILNLLIGEAGSGGGSTSSGIGGILGSVVGSLFGVASGSGSAFGYSGSATQIASNSFGGNFIVATYHTGGTIGVDKMPTKKYPISILKNAIYAHNGYNTLASDEVPIIARKNERIYTPEQDAARNRSNVDVKLELINKTSNSNLKVSEGPTKQQGTGWIKQVWLTEMKKDKTFNRQVKNSLGM
jgi:TP901 family phage tail tape measure protein